MFHSITENVKKVWEHWNIRGAILFSLLLQILLILLAPLRKRTTKKPIILLIWSGYLLADATANFAIGLISNNQGNDSSSSSNSDLMAFWAPFLLVHLGGPDTITAFALEDNELWLRHLLALILQAVATGYVFIKTLPDNKLAIPTLLMFIPGIMKYLERTRSLYLASMGRFHNSLLKDPDPGPNYAKLMDEYASRKHARLPTQIQMIHEPAKKKPAGTGRKKNLNNLQVVHEAYGLFKTFRGLIVDLIFSFKERDGSRDLFNRLSPSTALNVLEVELNFIYEVLFTKVMVVHSSWGYFFRVLSVCLVVSALAVFHFHVKKHNFDRFDVGITYTLLFGAIALDVVAFLMAIFSDWTVAAIEALKNRAPDQSCWRLIASMLSKLAEPIFAKLLKCWEPEWVTSSVEDVGVQYNFMASSIFFRRWSASIAGHNLITYCLKGHPIRIYRAKNSNRYLDFVNKISQCLSISTKTVIQVLYLRSAIRFLNLLNDKLIDLMGLRDFVDQLTYVSWEPLTKELWELIFSELCKKSQYVDDPETAQRITSAKGDWVLQDSDLDNIQRQALMPYVDIPYDETLLLWHLATELLYNSKEEGQEKLNRDEGYKLHRYFSKILSDYMLYLLIMQPAIMSAVAGIGKIRFRDTRAEARRFFERRGLSPDQQEVACQNILEVDTEVKPAAIKGDGSKSILFDASMLAKELKKMEAKKKWELTSKIWVELLSYAASHCRATAHAQQVSKGGELITFVWLLMAHFGIGDQFQIAEGHARAKLIVGI